MSEQEGVSAAEAAFDARFGDEGGGSEGERQEGNGPDDGDKGEADEGRDGDNASRAAGEGDGDGGDKAGGGNAEGDGSPADGSSSEKGGADGGDAGTGDAGGETESERLKRLAAFVRTAEGRMAALEADNRRLREETDALRAAAPNPQKPAPVEIPEELAADAQEFDALCPDLSAYLREPGTRGDRLRKVLRDYGADRAVVLAEGFAVNDRTQSELQAVRAALQQRDAQAHLDRIALAHPEMAGYATHDPAALAASQAYIAKVETWIESLPEQEKAAGKAALTKGSSYDVNALLDRFKKSQSPQPKAELDPDVRRRARDAAGIDNSRTRTPAREKSQQEKAAEVFDERFR